MRYISLILFVALCGCAYAPHSFDMGDKYIGAKYISDPLGEEMLPDTDPLIRFDAFDCTTFVETVLAHGDKESLANIRYANGDIDFIKRNHFIESDWLPNNTNLVKNVSNQYGKTETRYVVIDKSNWLKRVHNIDSDIAPVTTTIEYIPYQNITTIDNTVPLIVLFIVGHCDKCDKIGTDIAVVHMGFLLPGGILRHASSSFGRVMDTNFYQYAKQRQEMKNNIGIALVKIK